MRSLYVSSFLFSGRERGVGVQVIPHVRPTPLDQVGSELAAVLLVALAGEILGQSRELVVQKPQQGPEAGLNA